MKTIAIVEKVYESSSNLFGVAKAFLLKFSVTLIVFQGLVIQFMSVLGGEPYADDDQYSAMDKTIRGYGKPQPLLLFLLSSLY